MIRPIMKADLAECLTIFHRGYETVAAEFGLTEANSPDRGRASLPYDKLLEEYESGILMYGYYHNQRMIGFLGMKAAQDGICKLNDIIILPEYRGRGCGKALLNFCKQRTLELGAHTLRLGMIDDNKCLRDWYEESGFVNVGYVRYEGAPYTVGKMECRL